MLNTWHQSYYEVLYPIQLKMQKSESQKKREKKSMKKVWGKTYIRAYWPNFYRWEQDDEDTWSYHIYINNEEVERCPLNATREEVDMRFHDILAERGIEDDEMYVRKEFKN